MSSLTPQAEEFGGEGGITSIDFKVTNYLLIIHSAFVKYLRKMGTQRSSASAVLRLEENL